MYMRGAPPELKRKLYMSSDQMTPQVSTTTHVALLTPGSMVHNESVETVTKRDPIFEAKIASNNVFAFFYFDIVKAIVNVDDHLVETVSGRLNISKTYYIDGNVLNLEEIIGLGSEYGILADNMRSNSWDEVVRCRTGNFAPFDRKMHELVTSK